MLVKAYPSLKAGDKVPYKDLEKLLSLDRHSNRFSAVVTSWRKRLYREHNLLTGAVANSHYEVRDPHQRINTATITMKAGIRRIVKSGDLAARTDTTLLDDNEKRTRDHLVRAKASLVDMHNSSVRQLRAAEGG